MFVYRIESQYGIGPYTDGDFQHYKMKPTTHPLPQSDGITGFIPERHVCGFKSMEQLLGWFDETALRELLEINQANSQQVVDDTSFHIAIYTVAEDHVKFGQRQLVFEQKHAKHTAQMPVEYAQKILEKQNQ